MPLSVTTAICTSFKQELLKAQHNFSASGGHVFKVALLRDTAGGSGTFGAGTTNYSNLSTDEASGTGYTAGGSTLTNVEPATSGAVAYVDFSPDITWSSATFVSAGAVIYNSSQSNRAVSVHSFSGDKTVSAGTFSLQFPTADASNAIIRLT